MPGGSASRRWPSTGTTARWPSRWRRPSRRPPRWRALAAGGLEAQPTDRRARGEGQGARGRPGGAAAESRTGGRRRGAGAAAPSAEVQHLGLPGGRLRGIRHTSASTRTAAPARCSSRSPSRARPWPASWTPSRSRSASGLQHQVPLATYVRKYSNMRFEPAGHHRRSGSADRHEPGRLHLPPAGPRLPQA